MANTPKSKVRQALEWAVVQGFIEDWTEVDDDTYPKGAAFDVRCTEGHGIEREYRMSVGQANAFCKGLRRARALTLIEAEALAAEAAQGVT